jgi:hypothetical protein
MSFAAITLCVASQRVFIVVVYFVINSVRKLLDIPSYVTETVFTINWKQRMRLRHMETTQLNQTCPSIFMNFPSKL